MRRIAIEQYYSNISMSSQVWHPLALGRTNLIEKTEAFLELV